MMKFTEKALKALADSRHQKSESALLKGVNIHPKDWYEAWGHMEPAKWIFNPVHGPRSQVRIYPHYTVEYGWEWLTEERFALKYGKEYVKAQAEKLVVG